ncbi:MAG: hypothetical protein V4467_00445 [Patescibacteria group bacterium]
MRYIISVSVHRLGPDQSLRAFLWEGPLPEKINASPDSVLFVATFTNQNLFELVHALKTQVKDWATRSGKKWVVEGVDTGVPCWPSDPATFELEQNLPNMKAIRWRRAELNEEPRGGHSCCSWTGPGE